MPEVVGAVLVTNNKVILTKRSSNCKSYPNKFEFPGGKVEKGEGLKQALVRELKEELTIDVEIKNIIDFEKNNLKINNLSLTLFIVNKWNGNIILDPDVHSTMVYIDFKDLIAVDDLLETDAMLVPDLIKSIF
ncbi:MAG: hypothetical protein CMF82_00280 [Candidatus Marinimicrobia bacterium]|nr:hypothetical protein [Candidatus Neomarinimicrobiota bacterium]|tara:strand:- start:9239 stop:9637 length:399 start_codon:yes stop_codon:yes gene_type:complete